MKFVFALLASVALLAACAAPLHTEQQYKSEFNNFIAKYKKNYLAASFSTKFATFRANVDRIQAHNAKKSSYSMAMNEFGDLTFEEFSARLSPASAPAYAVTAKSAEAAAGLAAPNTTTPHRTRVSEGAAPPRRSKKDWRELGAVGPVKNQGQCASSWAFAATAALEGALQIRFKQSFDLAESFLIDCGFEYGNKGCKGGSVMNALGMVWHAAGCCQTKDYPYRPVDGKCNIGWCQHRLGLREYSKVLENNEPELLRAVDSTIVGATIGVTSEFQFYSGGIFTGPCGSSYAQSVAVVGYDVASFDDGFYILRNSWGKGWGEGGYMRMAFGKNLCGIASNTAYVSKV